jgi:hypothetical protein
VCCWGHGVMSQIWSPERVENSRPCSLRVTHALPWEDFASHFSEDTTWVPIIVWVA